MKLSLPLPKEWSVSQAGGRRVAIVPGHATTPDLRVVWSPLILLPDEQPAWIHATLRTELPPGARSQIVSDQVTENHTGWPVRLVEATITPAGASAPTEWRLAAFYAFFEHAAIAMVCATSEARYRERVAELRALLLEAGPDWSGELSAVCQFWDLKATGETARRPPAAATPHEHRAASAGTDAIALRTMLDELDTALAAGATAALHVARGRVLRQLDQLDEALAAFRTAVELAPDLANAHHNVGLTLAMLGREAEAIAAWEAAATADPQDLDALHNAGLAHYKLGDPAAALASWTRALERAPRDFWIARKVIQAQYALGRFDDAAVTRARLREIWRTSEDPAVALADEFVFDQFTIGTTTVHAHETLRPRDPTSYALLTFRADRHDGPPVSVQIETSDYAKERGVPFVISILHGTQYRALGTSEQLPPYPELKRSVERLIGDALGAAGPAVAPPGPAGDHHGHKH